MADTHHLGNCLTAVVPLFRIESVLIPSARLCINLSYLGGTSSERISVLQLIVSSHGFLSVGLGPGLVDTTRIADIMSCHPAAGRRQGGYNPAIYRLRVRCGKIKLSVQQVEESPRLLIIGKNPSKHTATSRKVGTYYDRHLSSLRRWC